MPKKNTPRSKKNSQRKRLSLVWIIGALIVAILLVVFVILAVINQNKTKQAKIEQDERARFAKAEAYVKDVTAEVIALVGQPQKQLAENTCHYSSAKFEKGTLSCETTGHLLYQGAGIEHANTTVKQLSALFEQKPVDGLRKPFSSFIVGTTYNQTASINLDNINTMGCGVQVVYQITDYYDNPFSSKESGTQVNISCSDFAKAEIYTVKE